MILVGKAHFCQFKTIQSAVDALEKRPHPHSDRTIYILEGYYEEQVMIQSSHLHLKGIGQVVIDYHLSANQLDEDGEPLGTFKTATFFLAGSHHLVENLTIINSAGYGERVGQAIALYADCDDTVFRQCRIMGYQDTLFSGQLPSKQKDGSDFKTMGHDLVKPRHYRQYYEECLIAGSVDFIFGGAQAYFYRCELHSRKEGERRNGYITAASTPKEQTNGFVFQDCFLTAEEGVNHVYLGRPWRPYAKTVFIDCQYDSHIHPAGWHDWSKPNNQLTARYCEYSKQALVERVTWAKQSKDRPQDDKQSFFSETDFIKRIVTYGKDD